MRRVVPVLLLLVVTATACTSGADDETSAADGVDDAGGDAQATAEGQPAALARNADELEVPVLGARVVRTADLAIEVELGEFADTLRETRSLAASLGGFVESSSTHSYAEGDASGDITIRVPVDRYDEALARLGDLGTVERSAEDGEDVTGDLIDLEARLRALRAEEDALDALVATAANVNEVLAVRGTALSIREQIEQLAGQQASLEQRSAYSTIHVLLHESGAAVDEPDGDSWGLAEAVHTGVDWAEAVIGATIVAVAVALPAAPVAATAWLLLRRRRLRATAG